jgi:hypothetical protein
MVVQVRSSAIDKAWRAGGGESVWLVLTGSALDGDESAYQRFQASVTTANDIATARGDDNDVFAEAPTPTAGGLAVLMSRASDRAAMRRFVDELAAALESNGIGGSLTAASDALAPAWSTGGPVLAAFVAWVPDLDAMTRDPQRTTGWHVPDDRTTRVVDLVTTWAGPLTSRSIVRAGQHGVELVTPAAAEVAGLLARGVATTGMAGLEIVDEAARHVRQAALAFGGETVFETTPEAGHEQPWWDVVDGLRHALTALPADVNQGFVRPTVRRALSADTLDSSLGLPGIREHHVRYNKHLLDRFVPDVHGVQVLRDEHVSALGDTRGWRITDLAGGRHLVEAEDLEPWYADGLPNPAVLDAARAQFASILLTPEVIASHPTPW